MLRLVKPRAVARRLSTLEAPAWGREEFYAQTRLPVEQATTLAPELYTDDAVLAHEDWLADGVAGSDDFFFAEVKGQV